MSHRQDNDKRHCSAQPHHPYIIEQNPTVELAEMHSLNISIDTQDMIAPCFASLPCYGSFEQISQLLQKRPIQPENKIITAIVL